MCGDLHQTMASNLPSIQASDDCYHFLLVTFSCSSKILLYGFIHILYICMKSHALPSYVYFTFISTYMHGGIIIKIIIYLCNRHYYYIFSTNIVASYTYIYFLSQFLSPFPFLFHKNISFLSYMCMNNIQK